MPIGHTHTHTSQGEAVKNARTIRIPASWAERTEKNTEESVFALRDKLSLIGYIEYDSYCMGYIHATSQTFFG